jgi:hypothetical protein
VTKWQANTNSAVTNGYLMKGVNAYAADNPNLSPSAKAAQNLTYWLSQVAKSGSKWQANSQAVKTSDWVSAMQSKAVTNISTGVNAPATATRMTNFMQQLLTYIGNDQQIEGQLPTRDGTVQGGINRATAWINYMAKFKPTGTK